MTRRISLVPVTYGKMPGLQKSPQCKPQIKLTQINLQTIREKDIDMAIINDPYRNHGGGIYAKELTGQTAQWAYAEQARQEIIGHLGDKLVSAKLKGIHVYSCYAVPSATSAEFEQILNDHILNARAR